MKGIILAGGSGTRLHPLTIAVSKQLLPINDKPMIYYPLSTLLSAGIKDILIISTPEDIDSYERLLGDGSKIGVKISYKIQEKPEGLAQAFIIGKEFIKEENVCLILGDNVFYGNGLDSQLEKIKESVNKKNEAYIFGYKVKDPQRFGVAEFNDSYQILGIEEKPVKPKSNYAIVGLYFYPNDVVKHVNKIEKSARGELEITSLNNLFLNDKRLNIELLDNNFFWLDTGTNNSMIEASAFIKSLEQEKDIKVGCIEEIALRKNFISKTKLKELLQEVGESDYYNYLRKYV
tara:strand:+ start:1269 stop:2138 length:870 start_codon:yes stop_codon:yes gene_type:complete